MEYSPRGNEWVNFPLSPETDRIPIVRVASDLKEEQATRISLKKRLKRKMT
jgi:hypothetical protein